MTTPVNQGATYLPTAGEGKVAQFPGVYAGTVVNNADPLGVGRLLLYVPQVLGNTVSPWAVPAGTYFTIPNNNTPVSVTFLGGDPAQPLWNGPLDLSPIVEAAAAPTVTYSSTQPNNPKVGDVWYQLVGGAQQAPQVWTFFPMTSTYGWVTQPSLGSAALAPGSVINGTIAAGAIDGMVINGNVINGAVINGADINVTAGTNNGLFLYSSGVPTVKRAFINTTTNTPGGTSTAYTATLSTTLGSAILVSLGIGTSNTDLVTSVTDSKSNTYTRVNTEPGALSTQGRSYQYLALNATALTTSDTVTVHYSSAPSSYIRIQALECTGVATSSAVDTTAVVNGTTPLSLASGTLASAPELVIGTWNTTGGAGFITDSVFALAAPSQSGFLTSYVTAATTVGVTNTVTFNLGGFHTSGGGCLVSLKGSGSPVLLGTGAAVSGTDQYSNAFKEGFSVYSGNAYAQLHVNGAGPYPALDMATGQTSESSHPAMYTQGINTGLVNEAEQLAIVGPASSFDHRQPGIWLVSAAKDGSTLAGVMASQGGGMEGRVPIVLTDRTLRTVTFSSGVGGGQVSGEWFPPANDAQTGTVYKITSFGLGSGGSAASTWYFSNAGFNQTDQGGIKVPNTDIVGGNNGLSFAIVMESWAQVITPGNPAVVQFTTRVTISPNFNTGTTQAETIVLVGSTNQTSADTTAVYGMLQAAGISIASSGTSGTITFYSSYIERLGP